ncbi:MAG: hypothetical protein DBY38_03650 [Clostridium cadaveris]|uniref:Uncharacterized protein n=1 Tax=Clostridium cadaveris TaxID=1529 RepID=A0A316MDI2_9CLOT|nr:MAG: hypothetical protein DBY38_03650 [Clostridium cadaveris]
MENIILISYEYRFNTKWSLSHISSSIFILHVFMECYFNFKSFILKALHKIRQKYVKNKL